MSLRLGEDIVMPQRVDVVDVRLLEAVAEELAAGKILIAQAITDKGVPASADESLSALAEKIGEIN